MGEHINASILEAAVGLLQPYCKNLNSETLKVALQKISVPEPSITVRPEKPYSRKEVADLLQVSMNTINRYMNNGLLKRIYVGPRHVLIDPVSVHTLLAGGVCGPKI